MDVARAVGAHDWKKMQAFDHVLTAHDPTRLEARSKALLAGLHFPHAFHAQDAVAIRDKATCKEVTHSVAVKHTVIFV